MKIVVDCANGAAYKVGPRVLADLGAEIVPIGCSPNGRNINDGCGSTAPDLLQLTCAGRSCTCRTRARRRRRPPWSWSITLGESWMGDQSFCTSSLARERRPGTLRGPVVGTGDEQPSASRSPSAESGIEFMRAPQWAIAMSWPCISAIPADRWNRRRLQGISSVSTRQPRVTSLVTRAAGAGRDETDRPLPRLSGFIWNAEVSPKSC